jgi:hypothetical protein
MLTEKEYNDLKSKILKAVDATLQEFFEKKEKCTLKEGKIYSNGIMQAPDGEVLCRIGEDKVNWYLKKGLAVLVSKDPCTIKLKFEPKGRGHSNDKFYLQDKENKCVVCGRTENLSKHHVVPYCFRKFLPDEIKGHSYHDVIPVCRGCHDVYEKHADILKKEISKEYHSPMQGYGKRADNHIRIVNRAANRLLNDTSGSLGKKGKKKLHDIILAYYKKKHLTDSDIVCASKINPNIKNDAFIEYGKSVVQKCGSIEDFIIRWRKHFIESMTPKFMPEHWDANRKLELH